MDKNGVLTIKDWNKIGMTKHPIYGFGVLKNVEIFENPGILKLKNRTVNTGNTYVGLPNAEVYDIYGNIYTFGGETGASSGTVYKNGTSIQSALANPWDLKIYKDYLWVSYSSVLSCYGPLSSGSAQWFGNVLTGFNSSASGQLLVGQDDFLYRLNGNLVSKIEVTSSGTVGVAPSLSVSTSLDLKDGEYGVCLTEYGTKLVIGTTTSSTYASRNNSPGARLYSWNRQAGTLGNPGLADLPVVFNENGINAVIQHANKLYVSAGNQGNIYVSDGVNYRKIASLPYVRDGVYYPCSVFVNAMSISPFGTLLVGVSSEYSEFLNPGVYEIDINDSNYPVSFRTVSSMTLGNQIKIGFINSKDYQTLRIGWSNGATYGTDATDFRMYDSYGGVAESPLYVVGTFREKKTFEQISFSLASPLVSGQNIRLSYRLNDTDDFTTIGTWGYSTIGGVASWADSASISDAETIQIKAELDQSITTLYGSNIRIISVSLW